MYKHIKYRVHAEANNEDYSSSIYRFWFSSIFLPSARN